MLKANETNNKNNYLGKIINLLEISCHNLSSRIIINDREHPGLDDY